MTNKQNMSLQKGRIRVRMRTHMLFLILLVVLCMLLTTVAVLFFGGEFRELKDNACRSLTERTECSAVYLREMLHEKELIVQEHAAQIDSLTAGILNEHRETVSDLSSDQALAKRITEENTGIAECLLQYADSASFVLDPFASEGWRSDSKYAMTYTYPLTAQDGTVYGALSIGLTEETLLKSLSTGMQGTACFVLGYGVADGTYDILASAGTASLLGNASRLQVTGKEGGGVYQFEGLTGVSGSVQSLKLADAQWVLICVTDTTELLGQLQLLRRMLLTAVLVSVLAAVVIGSLGSRLVVRPLTELSRQIRKPRNYSEIVRFTPSTIYEIDEITDAVTQMQINVHEFSSQVSRMISIADVGLGTFMYDRRDDSVFVGQSLIKVLELGLPQGEDIVMRRQAFLDSISSPDIRTPVLAGLELQPGEMRKDSSEVYEAELPDGRNLWMRLSFNYSPSTVIGIVQDITVSMEEKNRIKYERDHDLLTGLLNRKAYYRRTEKLFRDKERLKVTAFIMVDLDNLKYVNDTYGHNFGDDYIRTAAMALKKFQDHGGIVSRLSGDEFSICLPGFSSKEELREIIHAVRDELLKANCLLADGTRFKVSGSMGVAWYPDDADSRELLMKYADFAMYTIKHSTKGAIAEFDWDTYSSDSVLLTGVEEMNRIIEESAVKYAFQSIVSVKTGTIYGYEALMRLQSKIFRSPVELLRTARTGAKLHEIEHLTWTRALADFHALVDAGTIPATAHVFINSISNHKLKPEVEETLGEEHKAIIDRVVLEILENETANEECTARKVEVLGKWGAQIALDDFGTGYNNEYTLLKLHPDIMKIDRSIIKGCDKDADRRMIIENLVKLARAKGIRVLAEGIETYGEMRTVITLGVDLLQGFYLARPLFEPKPLAPEMTEKILNLVKETGNTKA